MTEETSGTVAVLGAGLMGAPMAGNLAASGATVHVWNRTESRALAAAERYGLSVGATPAEAAEGVDVIVTMLLDTQAVEASLTGAGGALKTLNPGTLWLQTSTVGVHGEARLRRLAEEHELRYVDSPVLGTRGPAESGLLTALASGDSAVRDDAERFLAAVASRIEWLGGAGAGTRLKMVVNAWALSLTVAMSEAIAMAEGISSDPEQFLRILEGHPTDAPYARAKANAMLARNFDPSAHLSGGRKDIDLVLEAATIAGINPLLLRAVAQQFAAADDDGHGVEDLAAVYWAASHRDNEGTR